MSGAHGSSHSAVTLDDDPSQYLVLIVDVNPTAWAQTELLMPQRSSDLAPVPLLPTDSAVSNEPTVTAHESTRRADSFSGAECSPSATAGAGLRPAFHDVCDQLFAFINAFLLLNSNNKIAVITTDQFKNQLIYPRPSASTSATEVSVTPASMGDADARPAPLSLWDPSAGFNFGGAAASIRVALRERAAVAARKLARLRATAGTSGSTGGSAVAGAPTPASETGSLISGALSQALCLVARAKSGQTSSAPGSGSNGSGGGGRARGGSVGTSAYARTSFCPRVLLLQAGPDRSGDYVSVMNAIFVAQRQSVLLDAVQLGPQHSLFLRQAAYVTHSLYAQIPLAAPLLPPRADADATAAAATTAVDSLRVRPPSSPLMLLQHLFTSLLAPAPLRPLLQLRHTQTVDLRATCFCHSRPVEQAHVCPVCLAVYCQAKMQCPSCGSRFLGSGPLRGKVLAKPKPKNPSAAPATATAAPAHAGAGADTDAGSSAGATAGAGAGAGMVRRAPDTALEGGAAVKRAPLALSLKR